MTSLNKNKHLTLQDRVIIATGIENDSSKKSIAATLGKDPSTIGKEIKKHRECSYKCKMPLECSNYKKCKFHRNCDMNCVDYVQFTCTRRDRSPGACNGCSTNSYCRFDKFKYNPSSAHACYQASLVESREGVNLTPKEALSLGKLLKPLIDQGQSIYQILINHPEIKLSEKTLYTYIDLGVFREVKLLPVDLRRKTSRKLKKELKTVYKKRKDNAYLLGRKYSEYLSYIQLNPDVSIVQMDTVYNDVSNGPFIQTFKFIRYGFMLGLLHSKRTAESMTQGLLQLESILGCVLFNQLVQVLLTDRGTEFSDVVGLEMREDFTRRTRVYYCDPMQSGQKGSLENNHIELRYILPKETDLFQLGLRTQEDLNLVISHINSSPKEKLNDKK